MNKPQNISKLNHNCKRACFSPIQPYLDQTTPTQEWKNWNSIQTVIQKLLNSMSKVQQNLNLTLVVIGAILAKFNPIQSKQPLDKYERARILNTLDQKTNVA